MPARRCTVPDVPLTAWRIGFTAVQCDGCGREQTCADRPNGYAVLVAAGWSEQRASEDVALWLREKPLHLLCPACASAR